MKILDQEIQFDFYDATQMKRFDECTDKAIAEINNIDLKNLKQSVFIDTICSIVENCFESLFEKGSSKKIFQGKRNFKLCIQAFRDLVQARKEQEREILTEIEELNKETMELKEELESLESEYSEERLK